MPDIDSPPVFFQKHHDRLICLDSDGTVFDTMPAKHRCFCDCLIRCFGFRGRDAELAAEVWTRINLYSVHRGENRFRSLLLVLDALRERGVAVPDTSRLRAWTAQEKHLGNPALRNYLERESGGEMNLIYQWSRESDESIAENVHGLEPFPLVRETLVLASAGADIMVVSHTPCATLDREWNEYGLAPYVMYLGGQERGSKREQIRRASEGKYPPGRILMIGDSPGDLAAADANRALFFPIVPGHEPESWKEFADIGLASFFAGNFAGGYQKKVLDGFLNAFRCAPNEK